MTDEKRTIYVVLDTIAMGPMEMSKDGDLLKTIKEKYPDAKSAREHEPDSPVIIVSTKGDDR